MYVTESPGVYVKEVSGGVKPIAGVGTSTGAFVGIAEMGEINKAKLITNWSQFEKEFGSFIDNGNLAFAVYSFFAEGGTSCWVVRVAFEGGESSDENEPATSSSERFQNSADIYVLTITASSPGAWGDGIAIKIEDPTDLNSAHFKLTVSYGEVDSVFDNKSIADIEDAINNIPSTVIKVDVPIIIPLSPNATFLTENRPKNTPVDTTDPESPVAVPVPLVGGKDGIISADYTGTETNKKGLHAFDEVDDINIVAIPDQPGVRGVIQAALAYCKDRGDCFFIADPPRGLEDPLAVKYFKEATANTDYEGEAPLISPDGYGALYYPWIYISHPLTGQKTLIPPSGAVAGTYAYTDSARGVHKAPAGIAEGYLDSVVGIENIVTKGEHDQLNPAGINVIRSLPAGICIWGARTLSDDSEWLYVNVRRLLLNIEESIDKGTQWVVFEPNDPTLWGRVKRNITAFLLRVWRDGALFGATPDEAFFVKVDEENNPPEVRDLGQLMIKVGVAPVKPAEFVIIEISQKTLTK